jgi:hypothetical protein
VQSLLLAAQEQGVDTCVQGSVATWASPLRKHFDVLRSSCSSKPVHYC